MRNFVQKIVEKRKELIADIITLENKIHKIKTSEDDMLNFYGLSNRYY